MSDLLKSALEEAILDEYKARATYRQVIRTFGEIRPFTNIVKAEGRHIEALLALFSKYAIAVPEDDWSDRVQAPPSVVEACRIGVQAEIDNATMYDRLLDETKEYEDVQQVLRQLQRASKENHLPAFQRCAERAGNHGEGRGRGRRRGGNPNRM